MTRVAITGGTGFVGSHLAERLLAAKRAKSKDVVLVSRSTGVDIDDVDALASAFAGCEVVVHCAGINREIGEQTYSRVHVRGTAAVVEAAKRAGVRKVILLSFLRARPECGSAYHESKWAAEQLVRYSELDYTILKAGMIYGHGDHLVDHLSHSVQSIRLFATVGLKEKTIRPIPIAEVIDIIVAAIQGELERQTVVVVGAEELTLSDAVKRVARMVGRPVFVVPAPVWAITTLAQLTEWTMKVPLIAKAQARMLAEGVSEPWGEVVQPPAHVTPTTMFSDDAIEAALPAPGGFTRADLLVSR